jgi:hypothetical protein
MPFYTNEKLPDVRVEMSEAQGRAFARSGWRQEKAEKADRPAEQSARRTNTTKDGE